MQVSLTATGGLERRLEVAVPAQRVASEVEQRLKRLSRTARLKGFRPGKAPFSVVRRQFGDQVHAEVVGDLMRSSFAEAVSQQQLKPAGGPRIEPIALDPGADLRYTAVFEVLPDIAVRPVEQFAIERPSATVTEADIDAMIESMRRQRLTYVPVDRAARATDRVSMDFDGRRDGQPFEGSEGRDVTFVVGGGRVLPEMDQAVQGASAGDTRTVTVHYPADHASKELAGHVAEFTLTLKKVEEEALPAVDEEFLRAFGVEDGEVATLRTEVRKSMERELETVVRNRVRTQVMDALYRDNPFDVPRALVDEAIQRLQLDTAQRMGIRDASQLPQREVFEQPARRRVALGMLMAEIVRAQQMQVDRTRVESRLDDLAASYPEPEQARRAYLQNADAMRQIESAALEDQVVDWVLERAHVTDQPVSFKELTGFGQNSSESQ
jgi:trigger factor